MGPRRRSRISLLKIAAFAVAIVGIAVAVFAYGPGTMTTRGIDPIEVRTSAFYYRMWTFVASVAISVALLVIDSLVRIDDGL
jgi:hypothetical protein